MKVIFRKENNNDIAKCDFIAVFPEYVYYNNHIACLSFSYSFNTNNFVFEGHGDISKEYYCSTKPIKKNSDDESMCLHALAWYYNRDYDYFKIMERVRWR